MATVKAVMPGLHKALGTFPVGSAEYKAVHSAIKALIPVFGQSEDSSLVPQAIQQLAQAARSGGSLANAPATGLQAAPPKMPAAPGGGPEAMAA